MKKKEGQSVFLASAVFQVPLKPQNRLYARAASSRLAPSELPHNAVEREAVEGGS